MVALWGDRGPRGHVASLVTQQPQRSEAKVVQPVTQARPRPGATCHPPLALGCALWPAGSLLVPRPPSHVPLSHFRFLSVQRALYTWPHRLLQAKTGSSDEHGVPGSCVRMRIRVLSPLLDLSALGPLVLEVGLESIPHSQHGPVSRGQMPPVGRGNSRQTHRESPVV